MNGVISVDFTNEGTKVDEVYVITEPIALADVKNYLKIEESFTYDDTLLNDLITAAREVIELYLNRSLIPRTVTAVIVNEEGGTILPYGVPSGEITTTDSEGNAVTNPVVTASGNFRYLDGPLSDELVVSYNTAGFTTSTLPKDIKTGLMQLIAFWYDHRGDETGPGIPMQARKTLRNERIKNIMFF